MSFQVLTSFLSALMKYSFVRDLFLERLILSIRFFFSIILHANTLPVFVSIARQVFAQLPSPNFLSFIEQWPSTTFSVCISSMAWVMFINLLWLALLQIDMVLRSAEFWEVEVREAAWEVDVGQVYAEDGVALLGVGFGFVFLDGLLGRDDQPDLVGVVVLAVLDHSSSVLRPAFENIEGLLACKGLDLVSLVVPLSSSHSRHLEPTARVLALIRLDLPSVFLAVLEHTQSLVVGLNHKGELVVFLEDHELLSWIAHVIADLEFSISSVGDSQCFGGIQRGQHFVGLAVGWREDCRHLLEGIQAGNRIDLCRLLIGWHNKPYLVTVPMEAPLNDRRSRRCPPLKNIQNLAAEGFYVESQSNELPILHWRNLEISTLMLRTINSQRSPIICTFLRNPKPQIRSRVDQRILTIIVIDVKLLIRRSLVVIQHHSLARDSEALGLIQPGEDLIESRLRLIEHAYKSIIS